MNMRRLLPIIAILLLAACQKDFDELNDSRQRWVEFSFDPSEYLSNILVATDQGYELGANDLDPGYMFRIEGYCYDSEDLLVDKIHTFGDSKHDMTLKFNHLNCDSLYRFLFIADVVEYNSEVDYFEIWYQLMTNNFETFYLAAFDRSDQATRNLLLDASMYAQPSNQTLAVQMQPLSFNGYCIFTNLEDIDGLIVTAIHVQTFYYHSLKGKNSAANEYTFS